MRAFAQLYDAIDSTTSTQLKVAAMVRYFETASPGDAAWAMYFLSGRKLKRGVGSATLRTWLAAACELPPWLVEETYAHVGDLGETIALLTATVQTTAEDLSLVAWIEQRIVPLKDLASEEQRSRVLGWWRELPYLQCLVFNKLLTGSLRVGVSHALLTRALSQHWHLDATAAAHRLMGHWHPTPAFWSGLGNPVDAAERGSRPYPFFLAAPLESAPQALGDRADWQAEWKWDGIRAQLIRRDAQLFLWSRGEELITERFPDIVALAYDLPEGTVLDGEIFAWNDGGVLPFAVLQKRIGRKSVPAKLLASAPAQFLPYDLLEEAGADIRSLPLRTRRPRLERLIARHAPGFVQMPVIQANSWPALAAVRDTSRSRRVEGLMLKSLNSTYGVGRQRGGWWKWKIDPYNIDAVMMYAQPGHGRRANLYTDYTFGVWNDRTLVPVAKAYSGLSNEEILTLDRWIRQNTVERFGPVRSVQPVQAFELAFEGIAASTRHKAALALRFPRIARWRQDKTAAAADTLDALRRLL